MITTTDSPKPLPTLLLLVLLTILACFFCFWNLGQESIGLGDESIHTRVIQEMRDSSEYFSLTIDGNPYFNKPPFKMWLSNIPIFFFGESNFSYRFLDALMGVGTVLLTFFLGLLLFSSLTTAFISAFLLLCSRAFLFNHMAREAVQDSMLVFLSTLAMLAAWKILLVLSDRARIYVPSSIYFWGLVFAIATGLAVLTKWVAGLLPLIVVSVIFVLDGKLAVIWKKAKLPFFISLFVALAIPALYYIPYLSSSQIARDSIIGFNLTERLITKGFHHSNNWYYYFIQLFVKEKCVPAIILGLATLFGIYHSLARKQNYLFLSVWFLLPLIGYSFLKSRLLWYIAPAYPALFILCGAFLSTVIFYVLQSFFDWHRTTIGSKFLSLILTLFLIYAFVLVANSTHQVAKRIVYARGKSDIEEAVNDIRSVLKAESKADSVIYYKFDNNIQKSAPLKWREKFYHHLIKDYATANHTAFEIKNKVSRKQAAFVIVPSEHVQEIVDVARPCAYKFISLLPLEKRKQKHRKHIVFLAYKHCAELESFHRSSRSLLIDNAQLEALYGFSKIGHFSKRPIRWGQGPRSALSFKGDRMLNKYGAKLSMRVIPDNILVKKGLFLEVYLNENYLGKTKLLAKGSLSTHNFKAPASNWNIDKNVLTLIPKLNEEYSLSSKKLSIALSELKIRVTFDSHAKPSL